MNSSRPTGVTVVVNGRRHTVEEADLAALVRSLGRDPDRPGTAVARNGEVVPRREWAATRLGEGDRLEVLDAVGGG